METKTIQIDTQKTRAQFEVSTFNEQDRTIEVTAATERAVKTYSWEEYGSIDEILVCTPEACDLSRLNNSAPVLDNHMRWGKTAELTVGVVEKAWFDKKQLRCLLRFGKSEDDTELMNKVKDGIVTGVSIGYNVHEYQVTRKEGVRPEYRATKWEPYEVSFTPVQADPDSRSRSEGDGKHDVVITENTPAPAPETPPAPVAENPELPAVEGENIDNNQIDKDMADEAKPTAEALEQERSAAVAADRQRAKDIRELGKLRAFNGVPAEFFETMADEGVSVEVARARALAEFEKLNPINPAPAAGVTDNDRQRTAMAHALTLRVTPAAAAVLGEENVRAAAEYKGMSLLRMAEAALADAGVKTRGMSAKDVSIIALGGKVRGLHHTTDFPLLLLDTVNRTLLAQYQLQERTFTPWARRATISDFRPISRVRLNDILGSLDQVREGEEYKYKTLSEGGETYQLAKFGNIIGITWEAIVNDDLSAFTRLPQAFAAKAAQKQSDLVYNTILSAGFALMGDGNALFSAAHGNYTGTANNQTAGGTALSEASLTLAYQNFLAQKAPNGDFINVRPKFLVVGPKNAFLAMKMTSANYTPNTQANVPVAALTGLVVIVEPRITNYEWFLIADPAMIDTVEYAFLDGEEELFIEQREGFNIDGLEVKARMVFAAKAIDWRGMYRNNGAAPA